MKKIFTLLAVSAGITLTATAQRQTDISVFLKGPTPNTLNCTDSVLFGYGIKNNGPDLIKAGDSVFVQDPEINSSTRVYRFVLAADVPVGDSVYLYGTGGATEKTTLALLNVLYKTDLSDTLPKPFANGQAAFVILFDRISNASDPVTDTVGSNNAAASLITIACGGTAINPIKGLSKSALTVYPNPASAVLNIKYNFASTSNATARVMDQLGREVLVQNFGKQYAGERNFTIQTAGLTSGMYTIELVMDDSRAISKFTVK